ncbi:hypothetical protein MHBO_000327 [Bonamia ostreae]|uniref:Uncharacterized protein n=1 Tax=Bonamia ostreae TaxID=126728 RepID=A0ABV2AF86_9EUKA
MVNRREGENGLEWLIRRLSERGSRRGMPKQIVDKFPLFVYKNAENDDNNDGLQRFINSFCQN